MLNKNLRVGEKIIVRGVELSIIDRNLCDNKYGRFYQYTCKLQNGSKRGTFEFSDSIDHYLKKLNVNVDDIIYCILSDYQIVLNSGKNLDDIEQYLFDNLEYRDLRTIKRIAKDLLKNYELLEKVFSDNDLEKLITEYENY